MKKQNKGITLIALVITIIVLLILAGVSIATLTGENGILSQAESAKKNTTKGEEKEAIKLAYNAAKIDKLGGNVTAEELNAEFLKDGIKATASETDTIKVEFETGRSYTIDSNGKISDYVTIDEYVKVGDYVDYEPTKIDVNRTQSVEASKLTYTSPVGGYDSTKGIITHGNGKSEQTFTVKANDESENGLKWRVLSVSEDKIELISDSDVQTDGNTGFTLKGGIGYLYAEQELNEACKIYGYGYGADTSIETLYTVGGPEDTPITGKIIESGARSITIEDLNKIANITEDDYTTLNSGYGKDTNPTKEVYYPTLNSSNTTKPGQSTSTKLGFKNTYYIWNKSKISDTNIQSMIFDGNYMLASRCVRTYSTSAQFSVRYVYMNTYAVELAGGAMSTLDQNSCSNRGVRPIVTLKSEVIDTNTNYETEGEWKLK